MKHVINITVVILLLCTMISNAGAQDSIPGMDKKFKRAALSPLKASMYASALPGLGQVYNRKYWKVPIVYAGFGALGYAVSFNSSHFNKYMRAYKDLTDDLPGTDSYVKLVGLDPSEYDPVKQPSNYRWVKDQLRNGIDYYRRYRDLSYIGIAAWYLVTILDANVDASLFDYDITKNITASIAPITPTCTGTCPGISFTIIKNF